MLPETLRCPRSLSFALSWSVPCVWHSAVYEERGGRARHPPLCGLELLLQDGFDAPYAARGGFLLHNLEVSELGGVVGVGATADLGGEVAYRVDLDTLAVFALEDADGFGLLGLLQGHLLADDRKVALNLLVHKVFDGLELLGSHLLRPVEVKAKTLRGDVGTALVDIVGENHLERLVEKMRRRVKLGSGLAVVGKPAVELLLGSGLGLLLVLLGGLLEAVQVDLEATLLGHLDGQLNREAVGLVEVERILARNLLVDNKVGNTVNHLVEFPGPLLKGGGKLLLLPVKLLVDYIAVGDQLRVDVAVFVNDNVRQLRGEGLDQAKLPGLPDCTADETPEDIALVDVPRLHIVGQKEGRCTDVLDHHTGGAVGVVRLLVAGKFLEAPEEPREQLGLVGARNTLQEGGDTLHAHPGVDIGMLQRHILAVGCLVVLHEDVVPDFDPLSAAAVRAAVGAAVGLVNGDEHLGVGTAGAGLAGRTPPVVLLAQEVDVLLGNPLGHPVVGRLLVPGRILVTRKAGDLDLLGLEAKLLGQEKEGHVDGLLLEVVTEGPVPQHLEEGHVEGVADFVYVIGAEALLHIGEPLAHGVLLPKQIGDERMHARRREEAGGVVLGNEGGTLDLGVAVGLEKVEEESAQLGCVHVGTHLLCF